MRILIAIAAAAAALCGVACAPAPPREAPAAKTDPPAAPADNAAAPKIDQAFWGTWADGKAELAGYDLVYPRYQQSRQGVAVTIFVTETFSNSARVKSDPGKHPPADEFPVMKLNFLKDYQTGIYDYNDMLGAFVALAPVNGRPTGSPAKLSFSSQEWCGHVYHQLLFDPSAIRSTSHSYFDGEADQQISLDYPSGAISEDVLWHWARGMAWPVVQPGESRTVPLLISLQTVRHAHVPLSWKQVRLEHAAEPERVTVPAGTFEAERLTATLEGGPARTFWVERAKPHRILKWQSSAGEKAELLASDRLPYWQMNREGGEEALRKLGLRRRPPRTP